MRRVIRTTAAALAAGALAAGCGSGSASPGVANIGSTTRSTAQPTGGNAGANGGKGFSDMLAFSQCMRSHGVPNFPDPQRNGNGASLTISRNQGIDPNSASFRSAQNACRSLLPNHGIAPVMTAQQRQQALNFSRCIRAHGVPTFPDPQFSGGGVRIQGGPGLDKNSPQLQAAFRACHSILPGLYGSAS